MRAEQRMPKGILLGDCTLSDIDYYKEYKGKYFKPPKIENLNGQNLIARQTFINYFRQNFPTNMYFFREKKDFSIFEVDDLNKRKMFNTNLTLSYYACYNDEVRLLLAGPNKLLVIEDIATFNTLEDLQFMFVKAINEFKVRAKREQFVPNLSIPDFLDCIKLISQELFSTELFDKRCQYTASVFRKIHKIYNQNFLVMPNGLVDKTYEHM
jgi:hypothetical protein